MPLNTQGLSNNLTWTLFTLTLPPSTLWGTFTGAWRHNVLFRRAGNVQLSGENAPQSFCYASAVLGVCRHQTSSQKQIEQCISTISAHFVSIVEAAVVSCLGLLRVIIILKVDKVREDSVFIGECSMSWNQNPHMGWRWYKKRGGLFKRTFQLVEIPGRKEKWAKTKPNHR